MIEPAKYTSLKVGLVCEAEKHQSGRSTLMLLYFKWSAPSSCIDDRDMLLMAKTVVKMKGYAQRRTGKFVFTTESVHAKRERDTCLHKQKYSI